jgi:hypothetical protein
MNWALMNAASEQVRRNFGEVGSSPQKAAEFSGVAGEFRCLSLYCSQISQDL